MDIPSFGDPELLSKIFFQLVEEDTSDPFIDLFELKEEVELSYLCDRSQIQDSFRLRANRRARLIASHLIDEKGEIAKEVLSNLLAIWEKAPFIPYPRGMSDTRFMRRFFSLLKRLSSDKALVRQLRKFHAPLCHQGAEQLIRDTLLLPAGSSIGDVEVRKAILASCFSALRQNVGSCFATAPAILVHEEQIDTYLNDLFELLTTGRLKRTLAGHELVVPLSPSWGAGDLKKSIHLKDPHAHLSYSPGLMAALSAVGLLEGNIKAKLPQLDVLLAPFIQAKNEMTIEECLDKLLLASVGLTHEEIREQEMRSPAFQGELRFQGYSRKHELFIEFKTKRDLASAAFKAQTDNALLKAWEFTLASFCDVKMDFSRWNLSISLGLNPEEPGGIGEKIHHELNAKIAEYNNEIEAAGKDYEIAFDQLNLTEALLRQASSERDVSRLRAEHYTRSYHLQACLEKRNTLVQRGEKIAALFPFLLKQYEERFVVYFQEIYDPEMQDVKVGEYEDSPAGFRLIYKHGRSDPFFWSWIYTPEQYIDCLIDFFRKTEHEILATLKTDTESDEVDRVTSAIIIHLRSQEFLESSILRMAKAHEMPLMKNPLAHLDKMEKKPWAYTSGGTMTTLLKSYFRREGEITEEPKRIESEIELAVFLIDTIKHLSAQLTDPFVRNPDKGMLIQSPTHAFVLYPGWQLFKEGWQDDIYTYTWVRDRLLLPGKEFYEKISLSSKEQHYLVDQFADQLPLDLAHLLRRRFAATSHAIGVLEFRQLLLDETLSILSLRGEAGKLAVGSNVDAFLYQALPLTDGRNWQQAIKNLLGKHNDAQIEQILEDASQYPTYYFTSKAIQETAKACYLLAHRKVALKFDLHAEIAQKARELGLAPPPPLLFADTNWIDSFFTLLVNPGTVKLELWRTDHLGLEGVPMPSWKPFVEGRSRFPWVLYPRTFEYTAMNSQSVFDRKMLH